jgi:rhodanese-related sulfurtransferase
VALQLKRAGIVRVRPLHGGLRLWTDLGFPVAELKATVAAS